jgi:hypothetical protein
LAKLTAALEGSARLAFTDIIRCLPESGQ